MLWGHSVPMKRILVIDDSPDQREVLCAVLSNAGYAVEEAADGKDGLQKQREQRSDLAIVDIFMPEMDGFETMTALRESYPTLPLLAVSGGGSLKAFKWMDVAYRLGADRALEKPFKTDELLASVQELVGGAG